MGWGGSWGGFWAGGPVGAFTLAAARAVGARAVRVTFTRQPLFSSPIGLFDASNLLNWTLTRIDTGRRVPMLGVRAVADDLLSVELVLSEPFASSFLIEYLVQASTIMSADGLMLVDPSGAEFAGMPALREVVDRPRPLVDLKNPQTGRATLNGALSVGTSGDYDQESGEPLTRKLVYRRIVTALNEYYHLAGTGYGAGLTPKRILRAGDLVVLRTQLEAQILQEPEFSSVTVLLTLQRTGRLDVQTKLKIKNVNQQVTLNFPINPTGGSQV